jgi:hypothetical protein
MRLEAAQKIFYCDYNEIQLYQAETPTPFLSVRHFLSLLDVGGRGDLCGGVSGMCEVAGRAGVGVTPWSKAAWKEALRANW